MEKLSKTIEPHCGIDLNLLEQILGLYETLIDNCIYNADFTVRNIMLDEKGKAYIIDYGIVSTEPLENE